MYVFCCGLQKTPPALQMENLTEETIKATKPRKAVLKEKGVDRDLDPDLGLGLRRDLGRDRDRDRGALPDLTAVGRTVDRGRGQGRGRDRDRDLGVAAGAGAGAGAGAVRDRGRDRPLVGEWMEACFVRGLGLGGYFLSV